MSCLLPQCHWPCPAHPMAWVPRVRRRVPPVPTQGPRQWTASNTPASRCPVRLPAIHCCLDHGCLGPRPHRDPGTPVPHPSPCLSQAVPLQAGCRVGGQKEQLQPSCLIFKMMKIRIYKSPDFSRAWNLSLPTSGTRAGSNSAQVFPLQEHPLDKAANSPQLCRA